MPTHDPIGSPGASDALQPVSPTEKLEQEAAVGAADVLLAVRVAGIGLIALVVCPPLAVLAFLIVAPALVIALGIGLLAAVVSTPYLLIQHLRGHRGGHVSLLAQRARHAVRALIDLAPHRIIADARKLHAGR